MNSKKILIFLLVSIMFVLFLLLYRNYKNNEMDVIGNGFELIVDRENIILELEKIKDVLNINVLNIKNMELSDVFEDNVYWNIEMNNNIFIKFNAIKNRIENYIDTNDYTNEFTSYMEYNESKKFIVDKYINLGYNNSYTIDNLIKKEIKENIYLWEATFINGDKKIIFEYIPEINKIISIKYI